MSQRWFWGLASRLEHMWSWTHHLFTSIDSLHHPPLSDNLPIVAMDALYLLKWSLSIRFCLFTFTLVLPSFSILTKFRKKCINLSRPMYVIGWKEIHVVWFTMIFCQRHWEIWDLITSVRIGKQAQIQHYHI